MVGPQWLRGAIMLENTLNVQGKPSIQHGFEQEHCGRVCVLGDERTGRFVVNPMASAVMIRETFPWSPRVNPARKCATDLSPIQRLV